MKRCEYHFPSPRRARLTQIYFSSDDLVPTYFLEVNRFSIPAPVFYRRSLPKKVELSDGYKERQMLVIEHEPEIYEEEPVVTPEPIEKEKEKSEKLKSVTNLIVKKRDIKVKERRPSLQLLEEIEEPLEMITSYDRVSVVMAFRESGGGRLEGLKKCIKCLREQTIDCYIILIEQDTIPAHQDELEPLVDSYLFTYSDVMFNKSWAFNCGVIIAPDDLILLHDCDILVPKHYVKEAIKILGTKDLALPWAKILYLTEDSSKKYPGGNPKISSTVTSHQAVGGSLLVRKRFYLRIGGMDERFEGWGAEDNAFYTKAVKLGRINRASPATGITLLHHYHQLAPRSHTHNHINNHIFAQYCQGSDMDIAIRIRTLDPIGDPLKMVRQEDQQIGTNVAHVASISQGEKQ